MQLNIRVFNKQILNKIYEKKANKHPNLLIKKIQSLNYLKDFDDLKSLCPESEETADRVKIRFIITICFLKTNMFLYLSNPKGENFLKFSSGTVNLIGKRRKKNRKTSILKLLPLLFEETAMLNSENVAVHLINVRTYRNLLIKLLKLRFSIKIIKTFNHTPFNGCRKRKIKRKKRSKKFK